MARSLAAHRLSSSSLEDRSMRRPLVLVIVIAVLGLLLFWGIGSYNRLVSLDQQVQSQWAQVENVYQRRADLVPNLVATVQGAAAHERETLKAVVEARAKVGQTQITAPYDDPAALEKFEAAQGELSSALSRLMVVVEQYPQLKANENFLALQSQLEGTENRIAVERMRFNDAAREFNTRRDSFPTVLFASMLGSRFESKAYFQSQAGAETAPKVEFEQPLALALPGGG
jgi:LemA protein